MSQAEHESERAAALAAATAELRSCYAIVVDPRCEPRSALVHLRRAWQALAWLSRGQAPEGAGESLADWLCDEHLQLLAKRHHAPLHASLRAALDEAQTDTPWRAPTGETETELPRARELLVQLRALDGLTAAMRTQLLGRPLRRQAVMRWGLRAFVSLGLAAAFVTLALRPWQSEDIGPWRGAYYPSKDFEGTPELRREPRLEFDWKLEPPMDTIPSDKFSARYDTCLVLDEASAVAFMLVADDGARLFVDGELAVDAFKTGKRARKLGKIKGEYVELDAGAHHLRVEYFEQHANASLSLSASFDPEHAPAPIPAQLLEFPGMDFDEDADPCAGVR